MKIRLSLMILLFVGVLQVSAKLERREWLVEGVKREALVWTPATTNTAPLVFGFHGHGGSMKNAARSFKLHEEWPEAIVVYMHGLPTSGQLSDPEGKKNGWNCVPDDPENRDLNFFDTVYASVVDQVDTNRVYSMGHSNGGSFTYCLWAARGGLFTAMAPSGAALGKSRGKLEPKPAMHVAGTADALVKYQWQEWTMQAVQRLNACSAEGEAWASSSDLVGTMYASETGSPFVSLIYPGSHKFPRAAPPLIVRFFKETR